jgi:hypothetical protein
VKAVEGEDFGKPTRENFVRLGDLCENTYLKILRLFKIRIRIRIFIFLTDITIWKKGYCIC